LKNEGEVSHFDSFFLLRIRSEDIQLESRNDEHRIRMFYFNRWIVFVAACLLQTSGGLNYSFSVFSPALKDLFGLDEVSLGTVATLGFNMGGKWIDLNLPIPTAYSGNFVMPFSTLDWSMLPQDT